VLCLDLSESMNERSGVSRPMGNHGDLGGGEFDHEAASFKLLGHLAQDISDEDIIENGETCFTAKDERKARFWCVCPQLKVIYGNSIIAATKLGNSVYKTIREVKEKKKKTTLITRFGSMTSSVI
jgi:hypothetical protein